MGWVSGDSMTTHCSDPLTASHWIVTGKPGEMRCVFADKNHEMAYFSCSCDSTSNMEKNLKWSNEKRALTAEEKKAFDIRYEIEAKFLEIYRDSLHNNSKAMGNLNWDLIPQEDGSYILYLLQGTTLPWVIPYGNDYKIRVDKDRNITSFERCHKSYLHMQVDNNTSCLYHSHTTDNPYITATDICNSLLYGWDCYHIKDFAVVSTHFDEELFIFFNASEKTIVGLSKKFMEKVYGKNK